MDTRTVKKFTDRGVRETKPEADRFIIHGPGGLGLRVSPTGRKAWIYTYRLHGKTGLVTLGDALDMTVDEAIEEHARARSIKNQGMSPAETGVAARKELLEAPTLADLASEYIERYAKPHKLTWKEDQRILDREVLPIFKGRLARDIKRPEIVALLDLIVARPAPIQANRVFAITRKMFNWAIGRSLLDHSPCDHVPRPAPENQRDRVLRGDELKAFVVGALAAKPAAIGTAIRLGMLFLLATAQRPGEVAAAEWSELDRDAGWWNIPGAKAKNGLAHRVPLNPFALDLLSEAGNKLPRGKYIFQSTRGDRPLDNTSINQAIRRQRESWKITEPFHAHDLRRTAATGIAELGFSRFVIGRILNHVETGITRVYDRATYDAEKRQALDAWGAKLETLARRQPEEAAPVLAVVKGGRG